MNDALKCSQICLPYTSVNQDSTGFIFHYFLRQIFLFINYHVNQMPLENYVRNIERENSTCCIDVKYTLFVQIYVHLYSVILLFKYSA